MKDGFYDTRKEQMQAFARRYRSGKASLSEVLEDACVCGGAELQFRALSILRLPEMTIDKAIKLICSEPTAEVLGYGKHCAASRKGG